MLETILGIILIAASLILIVAVLFQESKNKKGLSGAITGGADNFFGKNQTNKNEQVLSKITAIVAIVFVLVVVVSFVFQSRFDYNVESGTNNGGITITDDDHAGHDHD